LRYSEILVKNRIADLILPHSVLAPPLRVTPSEFRRDLWHQKTIESVGYCLRDPAFSHNIVPACDRQTDEWTHDDSTYRASIASRGNKDNNNTCISHVPV